MFIRQKQKSVSANSQAIYNVLSTVILSGINFLTIPIFTRVLGAENYGLFSVYNSWLLIIACMMGLKTQASIGTAMYEFKEDYPSYRSGTLLFGTIISAVLVIVGCIFVAPLSELLLYPPTVVVVLFLCAFAQYVVEFSKGCFVYEKKANWNMIVSVALSVGSVGASLLLVHSFREEELYLSRVYGVALTYIPGAIILWIIFFFKKAVLPKKEYVKYSLVFGVPIIFHTLAQNILGQSDRVMLQQLGISAVDVGTYSFYHVYTHIVLILLDAFNTAWCPFYYDALHQKTYDKLSQKCRNYMELGCVVVCGFLLLSREVAYFFADQEYWGGMNLIPIMVLAIYFTFMYQFPVNFEFYNKKTKLVAMGTFFAGLVNIVLNTFMIPVWGMHGAGIATTLAYMFLFIMHYCLVRKLKGLEFHLRIRNFVPGLIAVLAVVVLFYVLAEYWYIRWGMGAVLGLFELYRIYKRKTIF